MFYRLSVHLGYSGIFSVLKSTGSAFESFIRDEHTTLVEVSDRIFSTSVDLKFTYAPLAVVKNTALDVFTIADQLNAEGTAWDGNAVIAKARTATLEVFAEDESASVQVRHGIGHVIAHQRLNANLEATLYKMAERILTENKHVQTVSYSLPNKHYIPVDMRYAGLENLKPYVLSLHVCFLLSSFATANTPRFHALLEPLYTRIRRNHVRVLLPHICKSRQSTLLIFRRLAPSLPTADPSGQSWLRHLFVGPSVSLPPASPVLDTLMVHMDPGLVWLLYTWGMCPHGRRTCRKGCRDLSVSSVSYL